jgi:hypothetical protein
MAGHELIDAYLAGLRRRLAWSPEVDDIVAEAEDHLLCAMEHLINCGEDIGTAQETVVGRFGDSTTVAATHAATSRGGLAMPTQFTRLAGISALISAVLWAASAALWMINHLLDPSGNAETVVAWLAFTTLVGAAASTGLLVIGLSRRHGGLGALGNLGLALVGLGMVATLMFWFVMGWGLLFAAGLLLVALAVHARGLAPTAATVAFGGGWTIGVITWSALRALEVGTRDRWGDYPVVSPTAIAVGVAILAPGLIGLGRWLSTETPQDLDSGQSLAAT